eukprot:s1987_g13.t1
MDFSLSAVSASAAMTTSGTPSPSPRSPGRNLFEVKRLFSASSDVRRLRCLETSNDSGQLDERQLVMMKTRSASSRLSQCKAKITAAAMRMDQLQRRPMGSAAQKDLAEVGRLLLEIALLLSTDRTDRSTSRSLTPSPRRRQQESPRFGASNSLREIWSPNSARSLSPRRDPCVTMRVPEEALLTKRAQNLILWALGSYGAATPSTQLLEACELLDVDWHPVAKRPKPPTPSLAPAAPMARRRVEARAVHCPHSKHGCPMHRPPCFIEQHALNCEFRPVSCPYRKSGCRQQPLAYEEQEHIENCEFRPVKCRYEGCKVMPSANLQEEHAAECHYRPVPCLHRERGCQEIIVAYQRMSHGDKCEFRPVPCRYADRGCQVQPSKNQEKTHATTCDFRPVQCQHVKRGCQELLFIHEVESHAEICDFRPVPCPFEADGCEATVNAADRDMHRNSCAFRPIPCPFQALGCKMEPCYRDKISHAKSCKYRPVFCKYKQRGCTQQLTFFNSARHASGCGYRPVPCTFEARGCEKRINARELEQHCESCNHRPVDCKHKGCSYQPNAEDAAAHAEECGFRLVPCPYAIHGCEEWIQAQKLHSHQEACDYQPEGALHSHAEKCAFRPVPCLHAKRGCQEEINANHRLRHSCRCVYRPVPCVHQVLGCTELVSHKHLSQHAMNCRFRRDQDEWMVVPPDEAAIAAVAAMFTDKLKAAIPVQAEGISEEQLNAQLQSEDAHVMALARRTLRNVEAAAVARRAQNVPLLSGPSVVAANAKALATALAPGRAVDVADLLTKHNLTDLSYHLQADQSLFDTLMAHTEEAKRAGKSPFAFVDLTSKECLPLWIPVDSVGGRFAIRDEEDVALTSTSPISNLGDLSKALKGATSAPRFFRSVQQWSAAFWRWAAAAICADHWQIAQALAHQDVILQLAEQERLKSKPPYAAFLYDEMARRQWARRAEKRDPTFDLKLEAHKIDKDLLEVVHQRLASVLQQAGVDGAARGSRDQSVLSQQLASAEAAQKKAEQAQKSLADAQRSILAKSAPLAAEPTQSQSSEQLTRKQIKTQKWFDKRHERIQQQKAKQQKI